MGVNFLGTWTSRTIDYLRASKPSEKDTRWTVFLGGDGTGYMKVKSLIPIKQKFKWFKVDDDSFFCEGTGGSSLRLMGVYDNGELLVRDDNFQYHLFRQP